MVSAMLLPLHALGFAFGDGEAFPVALESFAVFVALGIAALAPTTATK
jgi:hypothetical protein